MSGSKTTTSTHTQSQTLHTEIQMQPLQLSATNNPSEPQKNQIEVITIPFPEHTQSSQPTKLKLQTELLTLQVHAAKRELYARELAIYEKEKSFTEEELALVQQRCDTAIWTLKDKL